MIEIENVNAAYGENENGPKWCFPVLPLGRYITRTVPTNLGKAFAEVECSRCEEWPTLGRVGDRIPSPTA
jgi:hypothetical protein